MGGFNYNRDVQPLTKDAAASTGHISWIESRDAIAAIRAMRESVLTAPFNCAVWADAGTLMSDRDKHAVKVWRDQHELRISYMHPHGLSAESSLQALQAIFNRRAAICPPLIRHATLQASLITRALSPKILNLDLRADGATYAVPTAHSDGSSNFFRLLQSIESMPTWLIPNEAKDPVPYLVPPENSLILVTSAAHPHDPIRHTTPVTPLGRKPLPRTLLIYGID